MIGFYVVRGGKKMKYVYRLISFLVLFALFIFTVMQKNDFIWIGMVILFFLSLHYITRWHGDRGLSSLGFKRHKRWLLQLFIGFLCGAALQIISLVVMYLIGALEIKGIHLNVDATLLFSTLVLLVSTAFIGFGEEVLFRGYLINSLPEKSPEFVIASISAFLFALAHMINQNISVLRFIELILYGLTFAVIYLAVRSIWLIASLHWGIDFFYYFLGIGGDSTGAYVLSTSINEEKANIIPFLDVVLVLVLFLLSIIMIRHLNKNAVDNQPIVMNTTARSEKT